MSFYAVVLYLLLFSASVTPDCYFPLGLENYDIEDYQLSTSNTRINWLTNLFFPAWNARLNSPFFPGVNNFGLEHSWYIANVDGDWLQIDLLASHTVSGIGFQGEPVGFHMSTFYLAYSQNMEDWTDYNSGSRELLPPGRNLVWNIFDPPGTFDNVSVSPFEARGLRIYPQGYHFERSIRMEIFGCTSDVSAYDQFTPDTNDITQVTSSGNSILDMTLTYKHSLAGIGVEASVLDHGSFDLQTSLSVKYKKVVSEAAWRPVILKQESTTGNTITLMFSHAVSAKALQLTCDAAVITCSDIVAFHGKQLQACPPGFIQDRGFCYKHLRFDQSLVSAGERSMCPRMNWGEEVYMAYPRSMDELYLMQNFRERSIEYHIGLFRDDGDSPWFAQSGLSDIELYWKGTISEDTCATLDGLMEDRWCTDTRPMTCATKAQAVQTNDTTECGWTFYNGYVLPGHDTKALSGLDLSECMAKCQQASLDFSCQSIEWYGNRECTLSDMNTSTYGVVLTTDGSAVLAEYTCVSDAECLEPLMFPQGIKSDGVSFSASSTHTDSNVDHIRLEADNYPQLQNAYWYPQSFDEVWFQVTFVEVMRIQKLILGGGQSEYDGYVKTFYLSYSNTTQYWLVYKDVTTNLHKAFNGPIGRYHLAKHILRPPLIATSLRLISLTHHNRPCVKMELYGCTVNQTPKHSYWPYHALGMGSHAEHDIDDNQITSSTFNSGGGIYHPPWQARLGNVDLPLLNVENFFWAGNNVVGEWIQIDLLTTHYIAGLVLGTAGSMGSKFYMKKFSLQYSVDSPSTLYVVDSNFQEQIFSAHFTPLQDIYIDLNDYNISARYLRIVSAEIYGNTHLKLEIYGKPQMSGCPVVTATSLLRATYLPVGCSCQSTGSLYTSRYCLTNVTSTYTMEFTTMLLIQGIQMAFEGEDFSEELQREMQISYYYPGNSSWSKMWNDLIINTTTNISSFHAHRVTKATKLEISFPAILAPSSCIHFTIRACPAPVCPPGYFQYRKACLHQPALLIAMWDVTNRDWYWNQINRCSSMSWNGTAQMGAAESYEEHMFVYNLNHRTGHTMYNGYWAPNLTIPQPFEWEAVDNKTEEFIYWRPSQPDEVTSGHIPDRCAFIWAHEPRMDDDYCSNKKTFFCKMDALDMVDSSGGVVKEWYSKMNYKFELSDAEEVVVGPSLSHCLSMCERASGRCNSVTHHNGRKECHLSSVTIYNTTMSAHGEYDYYSLQRVQEECVSALVWPNYPLGVEVVASSTENVEYDVVYADLGNLLSLWWPDFNNNRATQFIQVDFHAIARVEKLVMLGGGEKKNCFVKTFRLLYTNDTRWWQVYSDAFGKNMVFTANYDRYNTYTAYLVPPVMARFIRIETLTFHYHICFSFEMYGCFLAQDDRNHCSVTLHGSGTGDNKNYGAAELNGNPHVFKTDESDRRGLFLLTLNHEFCFPDEVERFDIDGNSVNENPRMREFIGTLENGTVLLGISIDNAQHLDADSIALFEDLGIGYAASSMKKVYSSAFITTIGSPSVSEVQVAPNGRGPTKLQKILLNRKMIGERPENIDLPKPLAHWPLNLEHQHTDISGNNLHLEENDGQVPIIRDSSAQLQEYASFDGTAFLRRRVDKLLTLDGDFSIFLAIYPEKMGPIFEYHDSIATNYIYYLHYWIYDNLYKIYLQTTTSDSYVFLDQQVNHKAWTYLTLTYQQATKRMSVWRGHKRVHSRILPSAFNPEETARDYLTVGYASPYGRSASLVHYKGKMACLQIYNESLTAGQIYRIMYECMGQNYRNKGLGRSVSDTLSEGPLGMMSGFITEAQTKVSSTSLSGNSYYKDSLRLYSNAADSISYPFGCWIPHNFFSYDLHEWVEVDLRILHKVTGFATVGCALIEHFTSDFLLQYAGLDKNWTLLAGLDETVNMTASANFDYIDVIKSVLPTSVVARYVRLWLHASHRISLKFEILGTPIELGSLSVGEMGEFLMDADSSSPTLIPHQPGDVLSGCVALSSAGDGAWYELDFRRLYTLTSISLMYESADSVSTDVLIYTRLYNTDWDAWPLTPLLKKSSNSTSSTFKFLFIPAINTRFLRLVVGTFNVTCLWISITGEQAPECPPGSVHHDNKCLYNHYNTKASEVQTLPTAAHSCSHFTWATPGQVVEPRTPETRQLLSSIASILGVDYYKTGLSHSVSKETAFWSDGTSANDLPWVPSNPQSGVYGAVQKLSFFGNSGEDNIRRMSFCETRPSGWDTGTEAMSLSITADTSFRLFVDGRNMGQRTSWANPWLLKISSNAQVLAVEASSTTLTPGLLAYTSTGLITDRTWRCTNTWYKDWMESEYDDSTWPNATEIEIYGPNILTTYGFTDMSPVPYLIWADNYPGTGMDTIYCRKSINEVNSTETNSSCTERWATSPYSCLPVYYGEALSNDTVDTVIDCLSQCQLYGDTCKSVTYFTNTTCSPRAVDRTGVLREDFVDHAECLYFERWCSDCSDYILQNEFPKGLVTVTASDELTPASDGILNTKTTTLDSFLFWSSSKLDYYQWIEAMFVDFIKITGITIATRAPNQIKVFYVFYTHPTTGLYTDIRDTTGNFMRFVGASEMVGSHSLNRLKDPIVTQVVRINPQSWNTKIELTFDVLGCVLKNWTKQETEFWSLGMESGDISLSQLTASSTYDSTYAPTHARFNRPASLPANNGCWRPKSAPYVFTVDLLIPHTIKGVRFQTCPGVIHYIKSFSLRYSLDGYNWVQTSDSHTGAEKTYTGSYFDGDLTGHLLLDGVLPIAQFVQFIIVNFVGAYPGLRLEIIGKPQDCPGIGSAIVSIDGTVGITANQGPVQGAPSSTFTPKAESWCPHMANFTTSQPPWIIINLESLYHLTGVEIINATNIYSLRIMISSDGTVWREYFDEQTNTNIISVVEGNTLSFQRLQNSKAVKIMIASWVSNTQPCLQVRMHGCTAEGCPPHTVESGEHCYYMGATTGDYQHTKDTCEQLNWVGQGYPVMPKDWLEFDLVEALAYPDTRYLEPHYIGLETTDNLVYIWADNSTASNITSLPWSATPSQPCTRFGTSLRTFTSITCDTAMKVLCQVPASVSPGTHTVWTHRGNVFVGVNTGVLTDKSLFDCLITCQQDSTCQSILYSAQYRYCYIMQYTADMLGVATSTNLRYHYFQKNEAENCETNLLEDIDAITSIQASSSLDSEHSAEHAVYSTQFANTQTSYWQAADSDLDRPWINIDFGGYAVVKRILTRGAVGVSYWTTGVSLMSSHNGEWFQYYSNNPERPLDRVISHPHGLSATVNSHTALLRPFMTKNLQITVESYSGRPVLRVAVFGCRVADDYKQACYDPLGLTTGKVPASHVTVSSALTDGGGRQWGPHNVGLDAIDQTVYLAGWIPSPQTDIINSYIEVEFPVIYRVTSIVTQGVGASYITSYDIHYRIEDHSWVDKRTDGSLLQYPGSLDKIVQQVSPMLVTDAIRLYPRAYHSRIALRLEIVGCSQDCPPIDGLVGIGESPVLPSANVNNNSSSYVTVCRDIEKQMTLELTFPGVYAVTGFMLYSLNQTTEGAVNLTENVIYFKAMDSTTYEEESVWTEPTVITGDKMQWKWKVGHVHHTTGLKLNISFHHESAECVQIEIHGCKVSGCPVEFVQNKDQCYHFYDDPYRASFVGESFLSAEDTCKSLSFGDTGHVVHPKSIEEDLFLQFLWPSSSFYVGVSYDVDRLDWLSVQENRSLPYAHWDVSRSQPNPNQGHCVHDTAGYWQAGVCTHGNTLCQTKALDFDYFEWIPIDKVEVQNVEPLKTINGTLSVASCLKICNTIDTCESVEFDGDAHHCLVYNTTRYTAPMTLATGANVYYEKLYSDTCVGPLLDLLVFTMTASSEISPRTADTAAVTRLQAPGSYWRPASSNLNQWIQVEFEQDITLHHLVLLGAAVKSADMRVTRFGLQGTRDGITWFSVVNEITQTEIFITYENQFGLSQFTFFQTISGKVFKITPLAWKTAIALQLKIYGCLSKVDLEDCTISPRPLIYVPELSASKPLKCFDTWTVMLTHQHGRSDFDKPWEDFSQGFTSNDSSEYYIGNAALQYLASKVPYIIRIDMWVDNTKYMHTEFKNFRITQKEDKYKLYINDFIGGAGGNGSLQLHNGMEFLTTDRENSTGNNCSRVTGSGWWYLSNDGIPQCFYSVLTSPDIQWYMHSMGTTQSVQKVITRIKANMEQVNVAALGEVYQSSTLSHDTDAAFAVDGYSVNDPLTSLCAATHTEYNPYWVVKLDKAFYIASVSLVIMQGTPLEHIAVKVGKLGDILHPNISSYDLCNIVLPTSERFQMECVRPMEGDVVAVTPANDSLTSLSLCEVEVYTTFIGVGLGFPCTWDADCTVDFSQCLPRSVEERELNFTCQCQEGYLPEHGVCKPNVDISISLAIDAHMNVLVRGLTMTVELTFRLENRDPRDVWQGSEANHNFQLNVSVADGSESVIQGNMNTTYTKGSAYDGILASDVIEQTLITEVFFTPSQCHDVRFMCVELIRNMNASYFERNDTNNRYCLNVENITICKPDADVILSSVEYNDSSLVTRNVQGPYSICVELNMVSGLYPIVVLDGLDVNYKLFYFSSEVDVVDGSSYADPSGLQPVHLDLMDGQRPLDDQSLRVCGLASIMMNYSLCTQTSYICLLITDSLTATYTESLYQNNIKCLHITDTKICKPEIEIDILDVTLPNDAFFIRGYNFTPSLDLTFRNNHTIIPVDSVLDPATNFHIEVMLSDSASDHSGGASQQIDTAFTLSDLQKGIQPGADLTLSTELDVLIPRSACPQPAYLCVNITPGQDATFVSAAKRSHGNCINITQLVNCQGLPVKGATFKVSPDIQILRSAVSFDVSWDEGTDVNFTMSLGYNDTVIDWNWEMSGHVKEFGFKDYSATHVYPEIGNYSTTLRIWNHVGGDILHQSIIIEPNLNEYVNISTIYTPNAVPVEVVYQFQHLFSQIGVAIPMTCTLSYGDNSSDIMTIVVQEVYNTTHNFTEDVADVTTEITCENHVSQLNFSQLIIFRQEISGLTVIPEEEAFKTGTTASFKVTMETGSHCVLTANFGDGTTQNFNQTSIYSSDLIWSISHSYPLHGNYTVTVRALNEHFSNITDAYIIIQNPVVPFDITGKSAIKVPDGLVTYSLTPQSTAVLPDNVFCTWQFDSQTQLVTYSTELMQGLPDVKEHTYTRNQVGTPFSVNATCSNLASSEQASLDVQIFEALNTLGINLSSLSNTVKENITFNMTLNNGSHVKYNIDYDDGLSDSFIDPLVFSSGASFIHSYNSTGNFSLTLTVRNKVSELVETYPADIVIQNIITNLSLSANESVIWPPGLIEFSVTSNSGQKDLTDIHCVWRAGAYFTAYAYIDQIDALDTLDISYTFPRESVGLANITVNCSNLISWVDMHTSVLVVLDEVIIDEVITDWVWWTNTSSFNLTIERFGTHSCFLWDMGDNTKYFFGRPWCAPNATTAGLDLKPIDHGITDLSLDHIYDTWDEYTVTVSAFNHVSEDLVTTVALVKDWYCYVPNITYSDNLTDPNHSLKLMKSTVFTIEPLNITIDCMKSLNKSESVLNIYNMDDINTAVYSYSNVTSFDHTVRLLPYGEYKARLTVTMLGVPHIYRTEEAFFEVIKTPLDVSITGGENISVNFNSQLDFDAATASFDHDVDPKDDQDLQFEWSCRQRGEDFPLDSQGRITPVGPPDPTQTSFELFSGCFGGGPGRFDASSGVISINTGDMMPNKEYVFRVTAMKDTRVGIFEQTVSIIPAEAPKTSIVCTENCESKTALSKDLVIEALCSNHCETKFGAAEFLWRLSRWNDSVSAYEEYDNLEDITSGVSSSVFHLTPWSLVGGVTHSLVLEAWTPGSFHSFTTYNFLANLPPSGGSCLVDPMQGVAAQTFFTFVCTDWKEWENKDQSGLKYEYSVRSYGDTRSYLVYYGNDFTSSPAMLPMGNYDVGFINEMELYIYDSVGDYYIQFENVTVTPLPVLKAEVATGILNDLTDPHSNISLSFQNGDYQVVSSTAYSMISLLNLPLDFDLGGNLTEDLSEVLTLRRSARSNLVNIMSSVPVTDTDGLIQTNEVFRTLLLREQEVTLNSQEQSLSKVSNMTSFFVESSGNVTKKVKSQMTTDMVSSTLRLVLAADFVLTDEDTSVNDSTTNLTTPGPTVIPGQNTATRDRVGTVMKESVGVIDTLADHLFIDKTVGDPENVVDLGNITVVMAKDAGSSLTNATFSNKHGAVTLNDIGPVLENSTTPCVERTMMFSQINPFIWDNSSNLVNSPVISFVLKDCDSNNIVASNRKKRATNDISDDTTSFTLEMPVTPSGESILVNETITDVHGMIYHYLNLTSPVKPVFISVYPRENESLTVYVSLDTKPTPTDNYAHFQVPKMNEDSYEEKHMFMLPVNVIQNTTVIHIGVKKNGCQRNKTCVEAAYTEDGSVVYTYRFTMVQCQYWDEELEVWASKGCQLEPGSTPTKARFTSNLFGSLGAGMFVGPNTIDFGSVFDNLDKKLAENAAVVGTVIGVILLYIPLVLICGYFDKKDKLKWMILPLVDNNSTDQYEYEVHIYTGLSSTSGTDSAISLVLAGTDSDTGIRALQDGKRKNFQQAEVSSFLLKTSASLGVPITLKIWHDNSGEGSQAGWFLSKVVVVDVQTHKWYLFKCERWLSAEEEDGRIERILHLARPDELGEHEGALLQSNIKKKLFDDHIWLSIGYRKTKSAFTRVQRLSCCLAILFLTMVSNAMWFGTGGEESDQAALVIGPISLTVHQLYTSVMSSLIVVPPVLAITFLFAKSGQKENSNKYAPNGKTGQEVQTSGKCCKGKFPHWVIYIAYTLVLLSVACGAFFTILYTFEWGKKKSTEWLVTFVLSFVESVVFIQPIKVIIIAALLTFLFKKDIDTTDFEENIGEKESRPDGLEPFNTDAVTSHLTLSDEEINAARLRKENDKKLKAMIREIVWQIFYLVVLLWVVVGNQDTNVYLQHQDLRNTFVADVEDMATIGDIWSWTRDTLVPGLYYSADYNARSVREYEERFIGSQYGMRLGPPRLRQLRVQSVTCKIPKALESIVSRCTQKFSDNLESKQSLPQLYNNTNLLSDSRFSNAFVYQMANQTGSQKGIHFWGRFGFYPSGGYIANLGIDQTEAFDIIDILEESKWIDEYTRVVFVEFNIWNANTNLFNMFILSLEILPSGGVFHWLTIDSINLYRYAGPGGLINLLAEIILTIFTLVITIVQIVQIIRGRQSCSSFWVVITCVSLAMFYAAFGMYVWRSVLTSASIEEMMNNKGKSVNFQLLTLANTIFFNLLSIMSFLMFLRMLSILRYNRTVTIMALTIRRSSQELLSMLLTFGIFFVAFCVVCYETFSSTLEEFSTVWETMSSLSEAFLGKFDFNNVSSAKGRFGGFVLIMYLLVMMLIIMNFFISLLNEFLAAVQDDPESLPKDHEVVDYLMEVLGKMIHSKKKNTDTKPELEETDRPTSAPLTARSMAMSTNYQEQNDIRLNERINMMRQLIDSMNEASETAALSKFLEDFLQSSVFHRGSSNQAECGTKEEHQDFPEVALDDLEEIDLVDTEELAMLKDIALIATVNYNLQNS